MNSENFYDGARDAHLTREERVSALRQQRNAERRSLLEKHLSMLSVLILVVVFALICLFLIVFPRSTVSQIEKRELAKFPAFSVESYFSGAYTMGIATFYDDTVPYHDEFKNIGNNIKSIFGLPKSESDVVFVGNVNKVNTADDTPSQVEAAETDASPVAESTPAPVTATSIEGAAGRNMSVEGEESHKDFTKEEADASWENGLIVVNQNGHYRALELFGGGGGSAYIEALNTLQTKVGSDVTIWSMPAPLACEFYTPSNMLEYTSSQSNCFDTIASKLNVGIRSINVCDVLAKHTEEPIYCRTDHHWEPLGAYYAAKTFAEAAGVPFADLSTYTKGVNEGFVGTMYAFTKSADILNDPEDFVYYVPNTEYEAHYYDTAFNYTYSDDLFATVDTANSYLMFMGGDSQVVKVDTSLKNGRKLLVIKDSYGNAEIPFYTSSFEQIYVFDMRYFERNLVDFIDTMGITDVLFTMSSYSVVGTNAKNLMNLITQDAGNPIVDGQLAPAATPEAAEPAE